MIYETHRPLALIILDGWGVPAAAAGNALELAHTPYYDEIRRRYPSSKLAASGTFVGLTADSPGDAEAGHRTIGAGRVIKTAATRVEESLFTGELLKNDAILSALGRSVSRGTAVHLVGLLSDGGVHSFPESLFALLRMARTSRVRDVFVHAILDGRDVPPRTADVYIEALEIKMADIGIGKVASLCGRFYGMDEGGNWERTARAFTMMVHGEGERSFDAVTAIRASFQRGISDEFIAPIVLESEPDRPVGAMNEGDVVIFFNHKPGPMRQLVRSLAVSDAATPKPKIDAVCMTEYEPSFGLPFAIDEESGSKLFGSILEYCGIRNYRITESARAPHVSTIFNGGAAPGSGLETDVIIPSKLDSLLAEPESRSFKIADAAIRSIEADPAGIFIINLPAADLVSETRDLEKTVEALQFVDTCLGGIAEKMREMKGTVLVTASHSGCEALTGHLSDTAQEAASTNPVPLHLIAPDQETITLADGSLADVAPTMLGILGLNIPPEMSGRDLRTH